MSFRTRRLMDDLNFSPPPLRDRLPRDVTSRAPSRKLPPFLSFPHLILIHPMRNKASKRPLSTARGSDEEGGSIKRVRWESRSDDEEIGTMTASDDPEEAGEEGSTTPDIEKVRLFLRCRAVSRTSRSRPS